MIAIIAYGISNIKSVALAVEDVADAEVAITNDHGILRQADKLILPGVCSYAACMGGLDRFGLVDLIKERVLDEKIPILGICIGLQVFATKGYEHGETLGLDLIKGKVLRLDTDRVPHMGWNKCTLKRKTAVFCDDEQYYYFANSYHFVPEESGVECLLTTLDTEMVAAIEKDNIFGCQFHPERSGEMGLKIMKNFAKL